MVRGTLAFPSASLFIDQSGIVSALLRDSKVNQEEIRQRIRSKERRL